MATAASLRRARKKYRCDAAYLCEGTRKIEPSATYRRVVIFPGHIANTSHAPYALRYCEACSERYVW